jgi:hypothetical protein
MIKATEPRRKTRDEPVWMARLLVVLLDVQPAAWRLVQVPAMTPLNKPHDVIQAVMGWTDNHLHEFIINGVRYGMDEPTGFEDERVVDERRATLADAMEGKVRTFDYIYDFGDNWHHAVTVEAIEDPEHEEHEAMLEWRGEFDPEQFDLQRVNARLGRIKHRI